LGIAGKPEGKRETVAKPMRRRYAAAILLMEVEAAGE
jgi:hypothetical protein